MPTIKTEREKQLEKCLHELLHWIYPREGDTCAHRMRTFIAEALIGFKLLGEEHPFVNHEKDQADAHRVLGR